MQYEQASNFTEGLASVKKNVHYTQPGSPRLFEFINYQGETVIPAIFDKAFPFSEGLAAVKMGGSYGYINRSGEQVIPPQFSLASKFSEGLAPVGFLDK